MKTVKSVITIFAFVLASLASVTAQAGDWPANAEELLQKKSISFSVAQAGQINQATVRVIVRLAEKNYQTYTRFSAGCNRGSISEIKKISEHEVEIEMPKEPSQGCSAKVLTINTQQKSIQYYNYMDVRTNITNSFTITLPEFVN